MASASSLLKGARSAAGITQAELARRAGTTQPAIARLEREGANPRVETLDNLIAAAGYSLRLSAGPPAGLDETMIAANLRLTPLQRLKAFAQAYESISSLAPTRRAADGP